MICLIYLEKDDDDVILNHVTSGPTSNLGKILGRAKKALGDGVSDISVNKYSRNLNPSTACSLPRIPGVKKQRSLSSLRSIATSDDDSMRAGLDKAAPSDDVIVTSPYFSDKSTFNRRSNSARNPKSNHPPICTYREPRGKSDSAPVIVDPLTFPKTVTGPSLNPPSTRTSKFDDTSLGLRSGKTTFTSPSENPKLCANFDSDFTPTLSKEEFFITPSLSSGEESRKRRKSSGDEVRREGGDVCAGAREVCKWCCECVI